MAKGETVRDKGKEQRNSYFVELPGELPSRARLKNDISRFYQDFSPKQGFTLAPSDSAAVNQFLHRTARNVFSEHVASQRARLVFDTFEAFYDVYGAGVFAFCIPEVEEETEKGRKKIRDRDLEKKAQIGFLSEEIADKKEVVLGVEQNPEDYEAKAAEVLRLYEADRAEWERRRHTA